VPTHREKLLYSMFLNPDSKGYLRGLEEEFGESSNAIRIELNCFEAGGCLNPTSIKTRRFTRQTKNILCTHLSMR